MTNILGIDFMHQHKLNYDATSKQITFAHMLTNALYAVKEVTIPALSSMMVTTKYKGLTSETAQPIATIHAPTASYNLRDACLGNIGQLQKLQTHN